MHTNRQQYLIQKYAKQIHFAQMTAEQVDSMFSKVIKSDPTHTGKYMDWLLRRYFANPDDFDGKHRIILGWLRQFDAENKRTKGLDINCLTGLNSLRDFIRLTNQQKRAICLANTPPTLSKLVKAGDVEIILESERITIYKLNTFTGAKHFSNCTKWCSSISENHFEQYQDDLFVIKTQEDLYQLHLPSSILADPSNIYVCEKELGSTYPEIWQTLKQRILDNCVLGLMSDTEFKKMSSYELKNLLERLLAREQMCHLNIYWLPDSVITQELCYWMIAKDMVSLNSLPRKYVNPELCKVALEVNIYQIAHIPDDIDISNWVQKQLELKNVDVLHRISQEKMYDELTLNALALDGMLLHHIPSDDRNTRYCDVAVRNDGLALKAVPEEYLDHSICYAAVHNNPLAIAYVPDNIIDLELITMAINKTQGVAVTHIPKRFIGLGYQDIDGPAEYYGLLNNEQFFS